MHLGKMDYLGRSLIFTHVEYPENNQVVVVVVVVVMVLKDLTSCLIRHDWCVKTLMVDWHSFRTSLQTSN
jgi:hypothetical protein